MGVLSRATVYACVGAPPSLHEENTHHLLCRSSWGETGPTVWVLSHPHSTVEGVGTGARSANTCRFGGLVAKLMRRATWKCGYTSTGAFMVTVSIGPVTTWFAPPCQEVNTYPELGAAIKTILPPAPS